MTNPKRTILIWILTAIWLAPLSCANKSKEPKKAAKPEDRRSLYLRACRHDHEIRLRKNEQLFGRKRQRKQHGDAYYAGCLKSKLHDSTIWLEGEYDKYVKCQLAAQDMKTWSDCVKIRRSLKRRAKADRREALGRLAAKRPRPLAAKTMGRIWLNRLFKANPPAGYTYEGPGESGVDVMTYSGSYKGPSDVSGRDLRITVGISACAPKCEHFTVGELKERYAKYGMGSTFKGKPGLEHAAWTEQVGSLKVVGEWKHAFALQPNNKYVPVWFKHEINLSWISQRTLLSVRVRVNSSKLKTLESGKHLHDFASRAKMLALAKSVFATFHAKLPSAYR
jgi:hypothetical protein